MSTESTPGPVIDDVALRKAAAIENLFAAVRRLRATPKYSAELMALYDASDAAEALLSSDSGLLRRNDDYKLPLYIANALLSFGESSRGPAWSPRPCTGESLHRQRAMDNRDREDALIEWGKEFVAQLEALGIRAVRVDGT